MTILRILFSFLLCLACSFAQSPTPAPTKFPLLSVQVSVGTKRGMVSGSFYRKTMDITPKLVIQGSSAFVPIPALEATMIIVTMDTEEKYTNHREKYSVYATEILPIPAAATGARRNFEFATSQTTFDSYRDSSNVGGAVYKYFVFGLRDVETQKLVDFETNYPALDSLCKAQPGKRDQILAMKKGADFKTSVK